MKKTMMMIVGALALTSTAAVDAHKLREFDAGKVADFAAVAARNKERLEAYQAKEKARGVLGTQRAGRAKAKVSRCIDGLSNGVFPCDRIDLLAHLDITEMGVTFVNDIWGWTDTEARKEYALVGATEGTIVVDLTFPWRPEFVGMLPAQALDEERPYWRDIKVYKDHAFIISEQRSHGMQVLDLKTLRNADVSGGPLLLEAVAQYDKFSSSHNIVINEDTGFAYVVGANTCRGGLEMIDISDPANPTDAGCFSDHGYIHDAQCVLYHGPHTDYQGQEICFNSSANQGNDGKPQFNTLSIVDVTDKANIKTIANTEYGDGFGYSHQGWLTPDHAYFLHDDELDESFGTVTTTTTRLWNLTDLETPDLFAETTNGQTSIDHNLYNVGPYTFASNYTSGLRIFDTTDVANGNLSEVAFFDMYPEDDAPTFQGGTWSNYPFFRRWNVIAVSSMDRGLFVLQPRLSPRGNAGAAPTN